MFGFYQLKHEQDIFAQSRAYCCNDEDCTYPNVLCSAESGIQLKEFNCIGDYTFTCGECVDKSYQGLVCGDPKNSCTDAHNRCYGWCYVGGNWQWSFN